MGLLERFAAAMKKLILTERQAQALDLLCEYGETDLVAYKMGIAERTVTNYINIAMRQNGHPNRLTLALEWDRQNRIKNEIC